MKNEEVMLHKFGRRIPKGAILFRDGDSSKEMYVIHSGRVKITKQVDDVEKTLAVLNQGDFFGEMATLLDKPRSATAAVVEDSLLIVMDPQTFGAMISGNTEIALKIMKRLASRILEVNEKIENLMLRDNMSRIVHMLMHMVEAGGVKEGDYVRINISPRELANEADIDVHVVKDLLNRLSEAGIVTFEEKAIKIKGINKLRFFDFLAVKKESGKI